MRTAVITVACLILPASIWAQGQTTSAARSGKAVLEAYVSAWNRHDFAALDKLLAPDAVHEDIAQRVHAQGLAEIKKFMREEIEGEPDLDWRLITVLDAGPQVVAEWTWTGTFTGDGPTGPVKAQRISGRGVSMVLTENGQIKRFTDYYDLASFFPKASTTNAAAVPTEADQYIRDSESQWAEAVANGDVSVVQRILSDDFIGVDAGDGHLYPKAEAISWIREHHTEYLFNHLDEVKVRFFGNTAVAQGSESWERRTGEPRRGRFMWTDTWLLRDSRWQIVAAEDLIAPPLPSKSANTD